jgi:hypothetical protein
MRKLTDEDLKILLNDVSISTNHDDEIKLYEAVYNGLNSLPKVEVEGLAFDVVKAIEHKLEWQSLLKFYVVAAVIVLVGIASLVAGISIVDKNLILKLIVVLDKYKLICLFTLISCIGINILDKLLSERQHQS